MAWLLDTNHWISLLKGRCPTLADRLRSVAPEEVWLCSIVKEELLFGAHKYAEPAARRAKLETIFARHPSAPFDDAAAEASAGIRHDLEPRGTMIGPRDVQIAGLAISREWTLVTGNKGEFSRVAGLKLEDWTESA